MGRPRMMASNNHLWNGRLYRSLPEMLDAIAAAWIRSDDPAPTPPDVISTDRDLAVECVQVWRLAVNPDPDDPDMQSHMDRNVYTVAALAQAFKRLRVKLARARKG